MAIEQRAPAAGTVIHSDQGTQFSSWAFTQRAVDSGLVPSMGSIGDCYDNAVRVVLEPDASRAPRPATVAHPRRARQRDLRIPGDLPQAPATHRLPRDAHIRSVRTTSIT